MSETTNIEWATSTGNPWIGCTKVSPGCAHCYAAELDANRFSKTMGGGTKENPISHWGKGAPRVRTKAFWTDAVKWNREAGEILDLWERTFDGSEKTIPARPDRPRIFPSLCDWLDDEVPIEWLADFLKLIHETPNLDWLLLTKRPQNWMERLRHCRGRGNDLDCLVVNWFNNCAPDNIWLGVSVEDQPRADERIPLLIRIPAKVRFLSVEPLLSGINLRHHLGFGRADAEISWAIIGGESGSNRRDCDVEAIENVASQCVAAKVPCFVKQDSAFKPGQRGRLSDAVWSLKQFPRAVNEPVCNARHSDDSTQFAGARSPL